MRYDGEKDLKSFVLMLGINNYIKYLCFRPWLTCCVDLHQLKRFRFYNRFLLFVVAMCNKIAIHPLEMIKLFLPKSVAFVTTKLCYAVATKLCL